MRAALISVRLLTCRPIFSLHRVPPPYFPTLSPQPHSPPLPSAAALFHHLPPTLSRPRVSAMSTNTGGSADDNRSVGSSSDGESSENYTVEFALSPTCSLKILKGDITQWFVDGSSDAIINAANERMLGGGGVDGAIHRAAGRRLREACYEVPEVHPGVRCPTGEARITPGFRLPASHVIHTVGPIYDEDENPEALLESAYRNTLTVAKEHKIDYVAFPAISCGVFGYPYDEAASIAISTIKEFSNILKEVHFVLFSDDIYDVWLEKAKEIVGEGTETDNVPRTADDVPMGTADASKSTADISGSIADTSKKTGDIAMSTDDDSMSTADATDASQNTVDASKATNDVPQFADASDTHPRNVGDNASKNGSDVSKSA